MELSKTPRDSRKLTPITLEELNRVPRADTYRAQIDRENTAARHKLGHWLLRSAIAPGVISLSLMLDQYAIAPLVWGIGDVETHLVAENDFHDDGSGTVVLTLPGLGIKDSTRTIARPLIPSLSESIPNSRLFALEEGAFLHIQDTIQAVRDMLIENPAKHLILYGMSTGGKEMLYVMAALRDEYPALKVTLIADSSPFTKDTTYQLRDEPGLEGFAEWMSDKQLYGGPLFNSISDLYFSSSTRQKYMGNQGFSINAYHAEMERIGRDIWNANGTPTALRIGQLALVTSNKMEEQLTKIAQDDPSLPPITFIYIANGNDRTVDVEAAIEGYRPICNNLDMRFVVIRQPDLPHASENDNPNPYNQNITIALDDEEYFEYLYTKAMQAIDKLNHPPVSSSASRQPR